MLKTPIYVSKLKLCTDTCLSLYFIEQKRTDDYRMSRREFCRDIRKLNDTGRQKDRRSRECHLKKTKSFVVCFPSSEGKIKIPQWFTED